MNLLIAWNAWSLLQYLLITKWDSNCQVRFRSGYYKDSIPKHFKELCETVLIPYDCTSLFDKVFVNSASSERDINILQKLKYKELHVIEEGAYDYNEHLWNDTLRSGCYHSVNMDRVWQKEMYRSTEIIRWDETIISKYLELFGDIEIDNTDMIIYTDPLDIDFGVLDYRERLIDYIENKFPNKHILIKRHPRDCNEYKSKKVTLNTCNDLIPAQILGRLNCTQFYFYQSTGLFYIKEASKIYLVQFKEIYTEIDEFITRDIL